MRSILSKVILAPALLAAAALAPIAAHAEKSVKVPFSFTLNGESWPAGMYQISQDSSRTCLTLSNAEKSVTFVLHSGEPSPGEKHVVLKFDQMGAWHTLRSIQYGSLITPRLDEQGKNHKPDYSAAHVSQGR